jgi:DNA repair exonuclease SbcCD nuclease subunit
MVNIDFNIQNDIQKIYHISDIHIRNLKRHTEYKEVFNKFYAEVKKDTKDAICVVAGDIAHSKTEMSPELIHVMANFLKNISEIVPTIIFAGNHDCNVTNLERLDVIEPIVSAINSKNLVYFKYSDLYKVNNLCFSLYSIIDDKSKYIKANKIPNNLTKIALYHGIVGSIKIGGTTLKSDNIAIADFIGYDIVLLGDIHTAQTLQEYKIEEIEVDENEVDDYLNNGWEIKLN